MERLRGESVDESELITTAMICNRLGVVVTAKFIQETLKVYPEISRPRAHYWSEENFEKIKQRLAAYILST